MLLLPLAFINTVCRQAANKQSFADTATLGRYLFFDTRLSFNNTKSCASCHDPKFAFTDGYRRSITASGDNVLHNAPSLINISFHKYFNLANPSTTTLEKQHERPLFNTAPIELGAKGYETAIIARLKADTIYQRLFKNSFAGNANPFNFNNIITALATYVRSLHSVKSPYDMFIAGDSNAISASAKKGRQLFFSAKINCATCHSGPYFTTATLTTNTDSIYFNTGLYNIANSNHYPAADNGLTAITGKPGDDGKFKTPSLRNIALTAPYMHDGSVNTLEEVIDIYANGGRNISTGPLYGNGIKNANKNKLLKGFSISPEEKKHLIDFLYVLTDSSVLVNPVFKNPFPPLLK